MDEVRWLKTEGGKQEARDKEGDEKVGEIGEQIGDVWDGLDEEGDVREVWDVDIRG